VEPFAFECPRCHRSAEATLYGPCPACQEELRARQRVVARTVEVAAYEPKMNVTPNQVATKE
jgi:hypothetical protein